MKVIAAMSGGVDSAVAAARLVDAGHEVVGVHLALSKNTAEPEGRGRGCCTITDMHDARRAADLLGIPFYIWDFSTVFQEAVVADFLAEYQAGRTPNPCLRCNEKIKFAAMVDRAILLGYDAVATGHYAILDQESRLYRGIDRNKDQSYVLGVLSQFQLQHSLFPLGDTAKPEIRREASERGLKVASKPDSNDICFIPDGDTAGFLRQHLGSTPGAIKDLGGEILGEHSGFYQYTIGQRRGLGLTKPAVDGQPRYVLGISPADNTVTVGPKAALVVSQLVGIRLTWATSPEPQSWEGFAQVRAHGAALPAKFSYINTGQNPENWHLIVELTEPTHGIAPGQAVVCYRDNQVIGSATIAETR